MVQRKKKRPTKRKPVKRRTAVRSRKQEYPGWLWMVFGLAIGLSVAFAVYMRDAPPTAQEVAQPATSGPPANALDNNSESPVVAQSEPPRRFDFYNMLPNFEVVIPEEEPEVEVDREPQAIEAPGIYVLQAGSFSSYEDADRRRAQLALQGIESRIQRVSIDDKTYHRVRIGPISDLEELNVTRSRLRAAKIDVLRIRLGD